MVDRLDTIREAFDRRAPSYDASAMHRDLAAAVAAHAPLDGVGTILDIATGTGLVLRELQHRAPAARLIGIDLSPRMLAVAREALPGAELLEGDAASLPWPDGSVDLVTCVTALHIVPRPDEVVRQWRRVLREGGAVVTATFAHDDTPREHRPRPYPVDDAPFGSRPALEQRAREHGFSIENVVEWTDGEDTVLIAVWR